MSAFRFVSTYNVDGATIELEDLWSYPCHASPLAPIVREPFVVPV
jgi:hypothetical protein